MTYNLLKMILLPVFFVIDSKNCEFVPRGLQSWAPCL